MNQAQRESQPTELLQLQRPQLFFFSEPGGAERLLALLREPQTMALLQETAAGVALALTEYDTVHASVARLLQAHGIPLIAWICLPIGEGSELHLANYPRAAARYAELRAWAAEEQLQFMAIGLAIEPPGADSDSDDWSSWRALRSFARGLWLARDNALYPASKAAYRDLIATMHHDGYEVHSYQLPFVADDRRARTTLIQRALDIVDLPADVDVLLCSSDVPIDWLGGDLGGALIASYGPVADAIAIGSADMSIPITGAIHWPLIRRDLLLAAQHTDIIYINSLEQCIQADALHSIATIDWNQQARVGIGRRMLVGSGRGVVWSFLMIGRFGWHALGWLGWVLALILWLRRR
jgi:hypothetical protein